jgi:putative ABC transport system substrate-binding protein
MAGAATLLGVRPQRVELRTSTDLDAALAYVRAGLMISYVTDMARQFRRAGIYIDKILKGAKPGDLPVEQPEKFELLINLKTAKALV